KADGAFSRLVGLPPELLDRIDDALRELAASPLELGKKACFPYPPKGQMYSFHRDHGGVRYYFVAFYYFADDEKTLRVYVGRSSRSLMRVIRSGCWGSSG
ncbi:MAG: hypothetical protein NTZ35_00555, partial [Ignavibacteriales bacterium]|nr:hypothetical protein [Ignavibacteriales bacterium]